MCSAHTHKYLSPSYEAKDLVPVMRVGIVYKAPRGSLLDCLTQKKYLSKRR
jgi:hypothetical protein